MASARQHITKLARECGPAWFRASGMRNTGYARRAREDAPKEVLRAWVVEMVLIMVHLPSKGPVAFVVGLATVEMNRSGAYRVTRVVGVIGTGNK